MFHRFPWLAVVSLLAIGTGCTGARDEGQTIVITGSSTVAPLASEMGKRFEKLHPGVRIDVQSGGSSRGAADVRRGLANIGMMSRKLEESESDLQAFTIARDGICMIVHADNPVKTISDQQVAAIYTGKIENWSELGGPDAPITVVHKAEGRSTLELFLSHFRLENSEVQPDVVIGENAQGIQTVAGNPHAIGYVSIGSAEAEAERGVTIRLLALNEIEASVATVAAGEFPLCRPLNLVTASPPQGLVKQFIDFAQSSQTHDLVREQHFVPITP